MNEATKQVDEQNKASNESLRLDDTNPVLRKVQASESPALREPHTNEGVSQCCESSLTLSVCISFASARIFPSQFSYDVSRRTITAHTLRKYVWARKTAHTEIPQKDETKADKTDAGFDVNEERGFKVTFTGCRRRGGVG